MKKILTVTFATALFASIFNAHAGSVHGITAPQNKVNADYAGFNIVEPYSIRSSGVMEKSNQGSKYFNTRGFSRSGFNGDIYLARNITEYFRTEILLGHRSFKYKNVETDSATGDSETDLEKTKIYSLMFNQNLDIVTIGNRVTPYVTAGFGVSYVKPGTISNVLSSSRSTTTSFYQMKNSTNFTWGIGVGLAFKVTDRASADVSIKRMDYGSMKHENNDLVKLRANQFAAGVRFDL